MNLNKIIHNFKIGDRTEHSMAKDVGKIFEIDGIIYRVDSIEKYDDRWDAILIPLKGMELSKMRVIEANTASKTSILSEQTQPNAYFEAMAENGRIVCLIPLVDGADGNDIAETIKRVMKDEWNELGSIRNIIKLATGYKDNMKVNSGQIEIFDEFKHRILAIIDNGGEMTMEIFKGIDYLG